MQVLLAAGALVALLVFFDAVRTGLLGTPEMRVIGNASSAHDLRWYLDRSDGAPPSHWVLSAPLWAYRWLMLAWGLWLALAVLRYARWGWACFSEGGLWRSWGWARVRAAAAPGAPASGASEAPKPPVDG